MEETLNIHGELYKAWTNQSYNTWSKNFNQSLIVVN